MPCVSTCRANCKNLRIIKTAHHHHNPDKIAVKVCWSEHRKDTVIKFISASCKSYTTRELHDPYAHARKHSVLCVLHHAAMALVSVTAAVGTSFLGTWVPGMDT